MATELWRFETARFSIVCEALPEDIPPEDSFEFREDIDAIEQGDVDYFRAKVAVYSADGVELGADYLGCCAYAPGEFTSSRRDSNPNNRNCSIMRATKGENTVICHYFPEMVSNAIHEARRRLFNARGIRAPR